MATGRRSFLKLSSGVVGTGLALGELGFDVKAVQAAGRAARLKDAKEYTSICTFCSCGCGLVGYVKGDKLVHLEGDPDHVINEGALCSKGASLSAVPNSAERVKTPLYRAPGSDKWQEISWDEAVDRLARKIKTVRDANWIATEKDGDKEVAVNRTDAIAFLGGGQNTNEECYLVTKAARVFGTPFVEHQARL
ncbi:MAG TPA: molybdopterin-dependent oxidoreductase [Myxococcales bacterium]